MQLPDYKAAQSMHQDRIARAAAQRTVRHLLSKRRRAMLSSLWRRLSKFGALLRAKKRPLRARSLRGASQVSRASGEQVTPPSALET